MHMLLCMELENLISWLSRKTHKELRILAIQSGVPYGTICNVRQRVVESPRLITFQKLQRQMLAEAGGERVAA